MSACPECGMDHMHRMDCPVVIAHIAACGIPPLGRRPRPPADRRPAFRPLVHHDPVAASICNAAELARALEAGYGVNVASPYGFRINAAEHAAAIRDGRHPWGGPSHAIGDWSHIDAAR